MEDRDELVKALIPRLELLERGQISTENMAKLIAMYILDLFKVWNKEDPK